jgi:hypothetical protein
MVCCTKVYHRRDPGDAEEIEMMENAFDCLCASLTSASHSQEAFIKAQGLELMILMLREKLLSRHGALKVRNDSFLLISCLVSIIESLVGSIAIGCAAMNHEL